MEGNVVAQSLRSHCLDSKTNSRFGSLQSLIIWKTMVTLKTYFLLPAFSLLLTQSVARKVFEES